MGGRGRTCPGFLLLQFPNSLGSDQQLPLRLSIFHLKILHPGQAHASPAWGPQRHWAAARGPPSGRDCRPWPQSPGMTCQAPAPGGSSALIPVPRIWGQAECLAPVNGYFHLHPQRTRASVRGAGYHPLLPTHQGLSQSSGSSPNSLLRWAWRPSCARYRDLRTPAAATWSCPCELSCPQKLMQGLPPCPPS